MVRAFVVLVIGFTVTAPVRAAEHSAAAPRGPAPGTLELQELSWPSVGPANMGGRVSDFAVIEKKPSTFFLATGTGGLFKTVNGGTTWNAVFDKEAVASIGAVEVWQKNPDLVWVGTGEANSR